MGVYSIDPVSAKKGRAWSWVTVVPPPPKQTIWGYNLPRDRPLANRQASFSGRAPVVRAYNAGMLPATFDVTTATAPEKRVVYSFKRDANFPASVIASGGANSRILSWLQSIPANWTVYLCYNHEPNDDIHRWNNGDPAGLSYPNYVGAYQRIYPLIQSASLASGVTVKLVVNYMAYKLSAVGTSPTDPTAFFNDSWVPDGFYDLLTFDIYGNPGYFTSATGSNAYGTATGVGFGTTYPLVAQRTKDMFSIIARHNKQSAWGILEFNTPARSWDTTESARVQWHRDIIQQFMAPPMRGGTPPDLCMIWEGAFGVGWDQSYGRVSGSPTALTSLLNPYMAGSP